MFNNWSGALISAQAAGAAVANTTTATSLLPSGAQFNFPSNFLQPGTKFRVLSSGLISSAASAPGTLTLDFRIGASVVATVTTPTLTVSLASAGWRYQCDCTVRSIGNGTAATVVASGFVLGTLIPTTNLLVDPDAVGTGFNSTASNYLDHFVTWSVASASNTITLQQFSIEMLN